LSKRFTVLTLFPELINAYRDVGVIRKACESNVIEIDAINPRDYAQSSNGRVDDTPYGGGPGMVMTAGPMYRALAGLKTDKAQTRHVIYLSPQGKTFNHSAINSLNHYDHLIFLCGRYEGVDERIVLNSVDSEWSIGDYVVTGGELPALVMIDALARTLPNVLGSELSSIEDSFHSGLLDYPHYTRPAEIEGHAVPEVLMSGNHGKIASWRRKQSLGRTYLRRPELLEKMSLSDEDIMLLESFLEDN
jgi:tRNA (guanine37-N1)-methyltransferase|tara:strand:- start:2657 stop:3397 length:741 start_codon:yes stop_codon:yes gene_type:complete